MCVVWPKSHIFISYLNARTHTHTHESTLTGDREYMKKNHARFLDNILTEHRPEPEYFRVGYYGHGFPAFLRNKVFIHRGLEYEKIATFTTRLQSDFPQSQLLKKSGPPDDTILNSDEQFLQICSVKPVPEPRPEFEGKDVPDKILAYYLTNDVRTFIFDRPIHKGPADPENEFKSLWIERSTLTTCSKLPGTLRWSEVVHKRVTELSPLEHACESVENMNRELERLVQSYMTEAGKPISPLSMRLQGVIEAAVNGGIAKYQDAFFNPKYINLHPEQGAYIRRLKQLIMQKVRILEGGLSIHGRHAPVSIQPLHMRLVERFSLMRQNILDSTSHVGDSSFETLSKRPSILNTPLPPIPRGQNGNVRSISGSKQRHRDTTTSLPITFNDETDDLYALVSGSSADPTARLFEDDIYAVPLERTGDRRTHTHVTSNSLRHEAVNHNSGEDQLAAPLVPERNSPAPPPPLPPTRSRYSDTPIGHLSSPATPPPGRLPVLASMTGVTEAPAVMHPSTRLQRTRSMPRSSMPQQQQQHHQPQGILTVGNSNFYSPDPTSRSSPTNLMCSPISTAPPLPPRAAFSTLERHRSTDTTAAAGPAEDVRPNLPKRAAVRKAISSIGQMEGASSQVTTNGCGVGEGVGQRNGSLGRRPAPIPPAALSSSTHPPLIPVPAPPEPQDPDVAASSLHHDAPSASKSGTTASTSSSSSDDHMSDAAAVPSFLETADAAAASGPSIISDHEVKSLPFSCRNDVPSSVLQKATSTLMTIETSGNEVKQGSSISIISVITPAPASTASDVMESDYGMEGKETAKNYNA